MIAKNYILTRALEDKSLSQQEVEELHGVLFDEANPTAQINVADYLLIKQAFITNEQAKAKDPTQAIKFEDKSDDQKVRHLLANFPGSLEHYRTVLARAGLGDVTVANGLPEVELEFFGKSSETSPIHTIDVKINGENFIFDIDTSRAIYDQPALMQTFSDPLNVAALSDVFTLLADYNSKDELSESERQAFIDLSSYLSPYPMPGADLTAIQQQMGMVSGPETEFYVNMRSTPEDQAIVNDFPVPITSDGVLKPSNLQDALSAVKTILGDGILSFLNDNDIKIGFCDFTERANQKQLASLSREKSALDYMASPAGVYVHETKSIFINSVFSSPDDLTYTLIHEIGHAVNFLIQEKANVREGFFPALQEAGYPENIESSQIIGAQRDFFFYSLQGSTDGGGFPSVYGTSNEAEWFAELFAHTMLEKSGRSDLIRSRIDYNPASAFSDFFVEPVSSLMISKIVSTIEERTTDQQSFSELMHNGIDSRFWVGCNEFYVRNGGEKTYSKAADEMSKDPSKPSASLEAYRDSWRTVPLHTIYAEPMPSVPTFDETVSREFKMRVVGRSSRDIYLPDTNGDYTMKPYVLRYQDFRAIQIACAIKSKSTREEKAKVLLENGLFNVETLDYFLKSLTVLNPEEVEPYLNPDDLISETSFQYEQTLDERDTWLSGEDESQ